MLYNRLSLLLATFLSFSVSPAVAQLIDRVIDGDTIVVRPASTDQPIRVRIAGIDAPELKQPYGKEARRRAMRLLRAGVLHIETSRKDKYGRPLADIMLRDGDDFAARMVASGAAWYYPTSLARYRELLHYQEAAQQKGRGLWGRREPVPPWMWRQNAKKAHL